MGYSFMVERDLDPAQERENLLPTQAARER
jgi:hypothetical protein